MRRTFLVPLAATVVIACAGETSTTDAAATTAAPDTAALRAELAPLVESYGKAILAGDAAALNALYTDDAVVEITAVPTLTGRAAILAADSANFASGKTTEWNVTVRSTVPIGDSAVAQTGSWTDAAIMGGKTVRRAGRWLTSSRKGADGTWRVNYLMAMVDSTTTGK